MKLTPSFAFSKRTYGYNAIGNVVGLTDESQFATSTWSYGYDALSRLTSASEARLNVGTTTQENHSFAYTYSPIGNRLTETKDGSANTYTYESPSASFANPHAVVSITSPSGNTSFTYDVRGNLTTDGTRTMNWDAANRLTSIVAGTTTVATYGYDPSGRRVSLTAGTETSIFPTDTYAEVNGEVEKHVFANGTAAATVRNTGTNAQPFWNFIDHLNSTRFVTDAQAKIIERVDYTPFGTINPSDYTLHPTGSQGWLVHTLGKRYHEVMKEIAEIQAATEPLFKNANVVFAGVFGSVAKGRAVAASDIDIVVRFRTPVGLLSFFALQRQLEETLGKPVDLVTERALDIRLKNRILHELTPIYGTR